MTWEQLLKIAGQEPVFRTGLLASGQSSVNDVRRQVTRWLKTGKLYALRRGVYVLAPPYARTRTHPFILANELRRGSYVSLHSALAHYDMIPENVPVTTSVTTGRPEELSTPVGRFTYRHVRKPLFSGFRRLEVAPGQTAFIATPEKALIDLLYLTKDSNDPAYLRELRLELPEAFSWSDLQTHAAAIGSTKLVSAVHKLKELLAAEEEYRSL